MMLAILSALVLLAAVALMLAMCIAGPAPWSPWRVNAPWMGIAAGLLLIVFARREFRLAGIGLLAAGLTAAAVLVPGHWVRESFSRGGAFGWAGWELHSLEFPGLLWLVEWRGLAGLAAVAAAIALAVAVQIRGLRRSPDASERFAIGGAAVGSWVLALGWLIGPAYLSGSAGFVALSLWALSLGKPTERPQYGPSGYLYCLLVAVVFAYSLLGLTPMAHPPLWLHWDMPGADKLLHAIWGLYVTLVCCLGLAPFGRWIAVALGTAGSIGLGVAAEFVQKFFLPGRSFEWADAGAFAAAAIVVALGLLLVPYHWGAWRRSIHATRSPAGRG